MPLTADDRIVLIRVKIERARKHLRDLTADLLIAENVQISESKHDLKRGELKAGLSDTEIKTLTRLPGDVITAAGDVVHNLRSALDHLANQLVIVGGGKPDHNTVSDCQRPREIRSRQGEKGEGYAASCDNGNR